VLRLATDRAFRRGIRQAMPSRSRAHLHGPMMSADSFENMYRGYSYRLSWPATGRVAQFATLQPSELNSPRRDLPG
jgi:hypothetical protein